ncbi:hypothetical protein L218DRAFT_1080950 [Marasmius fiardii PR-910]|nr:hypothetical protein L218DRAFT_1080950 [Marasmius fiardii PR-910]
MSGRIPRRSILCGASLAANPTPLLPAWDGVKATQDLNDRFQSAQKAFASLKDQPEIAKSVLMALSDHLTKPLNAQQVVVHPGFVALFWGIVDFLDLKAKDLRTKSPPSLVAAHRFAQILVRMQNEQELKAKSIPAPSSKRGKKSKAIIPSSDEDSDDKSVQIIEADVLMDDPNKSAELKEARGSQSSMHAPTAVELVDTGRGTKRKAPVRKAATRASTVSIPYSDVPGMDTSSLVYFKAMIVLSKAAAASATTSTSTSTGKRIRIELAITNLAEESAAEVTQRLLDSQQISRLTSLVPFFALDSLAPPQLISIGNFLRSELSTLSHAVKYYSKQYDFVQQQLEDVNCAHMAKLALNDPPETASEVAPAAGPSSEVINSPPEVDSTALVPSGNLLDM